MTRVTESALFDALEEIRLSADYIAGLCDALILAKITGDEQNTGEFLAKAMQRNLNALYENIEHAQKSLDSAEIDSAPVIGACARLAKLCQK